MKELNVLEMDHITGGTIDTLVSRAAAAVLGGVTWGVWGTLIGGTQAGANGGLLGFGLIANAIGMFWGLGAGAVLGVTTGFSLGWDKTFAMADSSFENIADGEFVPWSQ